VSLASPRRRKRALHKRAHRRTQVQQAHIELRRISHHPPQALPPIETGSPHYAFVEEVIRPLKGDPPDFALRRHDTGNAIDIDRFWALAQKLPEVVEVAGTRSSPAALGKARPSLK
jgi:hypothetical protein